MKKKTPCTYKSYLIQPVLSIEERNLAETQGGANLLNAFDPPNHPAFHHLDHHIYDDSDEHGNDNYRGMPKIEIEMMINMIHNMVVMSFIPHPVESTIH